MDLLGVRISELSSQEIISSIERFINEPRLHHIVTVNPEYLVESSRNEQFKKVLNSADIATVDGVGIVSAHEYLIHRKNPHELLLVGYVKFLFHHVLTIISKKYQHVRMSGVDLLWLLTQQEFMHHRKVYLLGGRQHVATLAAKKLEQCNDRIVYRASNGLDSVKHPDPQQSDLILKDIREFAPDILLVAYGHPWQDIWIAENASRLPVRVAIGVGGSFDYIAGRASRAPRWVRSLGLEWLFRLSHEPHRLKRIYEATFVFMKLIIESK